MTSSDKLYVVDKIENLGNYTEVSPAFGKVIEFLKSHDFASIPKGKNDVDGANSWVNGVEIELVPLAERKPELHKKYFDIHIPLKYDEVMGVAPFDPSAEGSFNEADDIGFYAQKVEPITVKVGEFAIVWPNTCSHSPACTPDEKKLQKKLIAKVIA